MRKAFIFIPLFFLCYLFIGASQEAKAVRSLKEERIEILKFGIDTEIIELLQKLKDEKEYSLSGEVIAILENNANPKLVKEIFDYSKSAKEKRALTKAFQIITNQSEMKPDTLSAVLGYLGEIDADDNIGEVLPLLKHKNLLVVSSTIKFLGKKKSFDSFAMLKELFEDENSSVQIRSEIILAFGEQRQRKSLPLLKSLLADEDEDITLRRFSCDSLGKIGDSEVVPDIKKCLESSDNLLRAYAIAALGNFPSKETEKIPLSALRDSFPRVRELAAEKLGDMKSEEAMENLIYRAKKDSEKKIRHAAIKAIANIGSEKGTAFLKELIEDERTVPEYRTSAIDKMVEKNPAGAAGSLSKVMEQEWKKESSLILDFIGKVISQKECNDFEPLYKKMLDHKSFIIQIYAIRGIQKNKLGSYKDQIKELTKEKYNPQLRKQALSALE